MSKTPRRLEGKVALITGSSQGLGFEITKRYLIEGASVIICARSSSDLALAENELRKSATENQTILVVPCDIAIRSQVDSLFSKIDDSFQNLDIVVSNAGVHGPLGPIDKINWEDWTSAIAINLSGAAYILRKSVIKMKPQGHGKCIQLSGGGATKPHPFASSYAASKAAIVRLAETIAEEVRNTGIEINSIAPGSLNTRLMDQVLEAGPDAVGKDFYELSIKQKDSGGAGFMHAVDLALFLATSASDGITGKLISALWDDWSSFPLKAEKLSASDVFTLRRITWADRAKLLGPE